MQAQQRALAALVACAALGAAAHAVAQAKDWQEIQKPPLRPFEPQQPRRIALPNGMVIFLQEDHELPLVRGTARIRGGSREEPAEKIGLVNVFGQVWRTGGTKTKTGDQLDDELEARAARVETGGGLDSTTIRFDTLKDGFEPVFQAFLDVLRNPEFREDKLPIARNQLNTGIARRNDDPMGIASREARKLGYGAASPYARVAEYATVAAIQRSDLTAWHQKYVHPNNMILGLVGDFDSATMEKRLRQTFSSWPKGPPAGAAEAPVPEPKPGVFFVAKDDVNQSNIRMIHAGIRRDNPDYFALEVMNQFFGGSFASRLFSNIRSKKGLAYFVGGGVGADFDHPGLFMLSMGTKSETTATAIDALYEEIDNLKKTPATPEELKRAKEAILNSFVFRVDSKSKVLSERMANEFYGYPADFLTRYRAAIEKVTGEDVARVAEKYVHRDKLAVLVVGKSADFDRPLSTYGPVTTLDITIPGPGGAKTSAAAAGSDEGGKALLGKVIEGLGGAATVNSVKAIRQKANAKMKTPQGEMAIEIDSLVVMPDRRRAQMTSPMGTMVTVVSPEASFMVAPMGTRDMPASAKENALKELHTSPLFVAQHAGDATLTARAGAKEKVGDVEAQTLDVSIEGAQVKWWIDPSTGRILKSASMAAGPGGVPAEQVTEFSDWRAIDGLNLSHKAKVSRGGEDVGSMEVQEIQINPAVDATLFQKPDTPKP